ncbi:MAG: prolyl oligopeptidase family serine peptidase [Calditrichaeota bacterium]|nr:prolyl oligopeptidase family serine peptidase [Calditrichota bacterium]
MRKRFLLFFSVILSISFLFNFQNLWGQKKKLTYQQVYQRGEPRLLGSLPSIRGWADDAHYLKYDRADRKKGVSARLVKVDVKTGKDSVFFDYGKYKDKLPRGYSLQGASVHTDDYTGFIFQRKNDLYYFSTKTGKFRQLTDNPAAEKNPKLSPDGKWVAFTREHNLFAIDLETGLEHQLTADGSDVVYNGWSSWVYYEEILGRPTRYAAFWWSPNSEMIAFLRFDDSPVPEFPLFRADGVHGSLEMEHYPKAGDPNPDVKLGIVNLKDKKTVWVDSRGDSEQYIAWPFWTPNSKKLFFQWMNRGQNEIRIYSANPESGKITPIYSEKQSTWVEWFENIYFFKDNSGFLLRTAKDGWSHLYYFDMLGHLKRRLTKGEFTVTRISLVDEANKRIFFTRTLGNNLETHLYCVGLNGKNLKRLTKAKGTHRVNVSPGGSYFIDTYSNIAQPSKMELFDTNGNSLKLFGDRKLPIMDEYDLAKTELFTIPSGDGYDLPAMWYLPPDFDKNKKYPVIISIYGGPGMGTVADRFPYWLGNYFLAQNGIIVMAVDHRGSGHFGKKGEWLMYRNLGKWEMHDYIAAVKWLRQKSFIDSTRIGITGGSYGGYVTCMALTYGADYFTHGVAQYSVTDWRLYDSIYTERYMDTPEENPEGYKFGSVLTHADKYKGHLLITHGTMDDNVHMQNTIQFINLLENMNKDFELMIYPGARHGVGGMKRNHASREALQFWFRNFLGKELEIPAE